MRVGVLADIHANKHALRAVLEDAEAQCVKRFWFLGDAIGYGPHPVEVLQFVRDRVGPRSWVPGNHEAILLGELLPEGATEDAGQALQLSRREIESRQPELMADPLTNRFQGRRGVRKQIYTKHCGEHRYVLCHGSLQKPRLTRYIYPWSTEEVGREFRTLASLELGTQRVCLCLGHAHIPFLCRATVGPNGQLLESECPQMFYGDEISLGDSLAIVNPGSVGQPRDSDPRAAYAILDTRQHTIIFRRVDYEDGLMQTQREMQAHNPPYPDNLVPRLRRADRPAAWPQGWEPRVTDGD